MNSKKILIMIGDVGNGHRSAAEALIYSFNKKYPNKYNIVTKDLFKESDLWPYKITNDAHSKVSSHKSLEKINNLGFKITNTKYLYDIFTNYTFTQLYETTLNIIKEEKPELVISIHPIVSMVLERVKEDHNNFLSVVVVTDLVTFFRGWADSTADLVIAPTSEAVKTLIKYGVKSNRIVYPLFPINPKIQNFRPREEVLKELNLKPDCSTILITGGGVGTKSLNKSIEKLSKNKKYQLIVIAGKLLKYKEQLESKYKNNSKIKVLGYVNNIQDYINVSDIIITKPGPATILESEIFNKKTILTRKIGLQEEGNIDYALRNPNFRYIGDNWSKLEGTIEDLLSTSTVNINLHTKRTFDESVKIVEEVNNLVQNGSLRVDIYSKRNKVEDILAKTIVVSAIGFGVYKLVTTISSNLNNEKEKSTNSNV